MQAIVPAPIARQPWGLLIPLFALTAFGGAVLFSAGGGSFDAFAQSHFIRFGVFLAMAAVMAMLPRELYRFAAFPAYAATLLLLLGVELIGGIGGGSQRWLELGFLRLQPSELMKPVIVLTLAKFYGALPVGMVGTWRALVPVLGLVAMPMALVLLQPDLGTTLAIGFGAGVVLFLAGLPLRWFAGAGVLATAAVPMAYFFALQPYQQRRVTTFLDPESDPLGSGYHITQSKIAIGSGGLFGKGFNEGSQSHLNYLPEPHTDFVFATMAEEWGFLGGLFVLAAFAAILGWGVKVARNAPHRFDRLLAAGMVATMFFYTAINLLMVMGMAPVVGIPLPFMSHGGSSMLTNMICIGTLLAIHRWSRGDRGRSLTT